MATSRIDEVPVPLLCAALSSNRTRFGLAKTFHSLFAPRNVTGFDRSLTRRRFGLRLGRPLEQRRCQVEFRIECDRQIAIIRVVHRIHYKVVFVLPVPLHCILHKLVVIFPANARRGECTSNGVSNHLLCCWSSARSAVSSGPIGPQVRRRRSPSPRRKSRASRSRADRESLYSHGVFFLTISSVSRNGP
jgi:hypothetical protein